MTSRRRRRREGKSGRGLRQQRQQAAILGARKVPKAVATQREAGVRRLRRIDKDAVALEADVLAGSPARHPARALEI